MSGFKDFLKREASENSAGLLGKGFVAFDIGNLVAGKNKLEAIKRLFIDLILLRPVMAAGFAGLFLAMGKGIRSVVHDTGSLEAALKKLQAGENRLHIQKPHAPTEIISTLFFYDATSFMSK